jgi:hypothetical protein
MNSKLIFITFFFLLIFSTGFWLSRTGKPYSPMIFNLHKLIGLTAGIFLGLTVYGIFKAIPVEPIQVGVLAITVAIFVILVAAGGLLSAAAEGSFQNMSADMLSGMGWIHQIFPYLAVVATGGTLFLLLR